MASPNLDLLVTFAIVLIAAEVGSILIRFVRMPRVVGMLAAGALIGPNVNPFASAINLHPETVQDLAFLGGIFLMFSIGLSFNVHNFRRVGSRALLVSFVGSLFAFLAALVVAYAFDQPREFALFVALITTPTSSVIAFRLAHEQNLLATRGLDTTIGSIIVDDVVIIFFSTFVVALTATGPGGGWFTTALALLVVVLLGAVIIMVALQAVPRTLHLFTRLPGGNPTLLAISLAFLVAFVFTLIELPPIFGAFWAGSIIASSRFGDQVTTFTRPVTELFSAIFFTAIGMLLDPVILPGLGLLAAVLILAAIASRFGAGFLALRALKTPAVPALACATLLIPRGEVSLVIAQYAGDATLVQHLQLIGSILMVATTVAAPVTLAIVRAYARRSAAARRVRAPDSPRPENPS